MSIRKLTDSIRNYSESDLCFGTIKTLKMIDDKAAGLECENTELEKRVAELESELEEYASLIKLQHSRSVEASKLWQAAHNKPLVWPDLGKLLAWLMGQIKEGKK